MNYNDHIYVAKFLSSSSPVSISRLLRARGESRNLFLGGSKLRATLRARIENAKSLRIEGEALTESGPHEKIRKIFLIFSRAFEGSRTKLGEPLPREFLKNQTWNRSFWYILEAKIWKNNHIWLKGILNGPVSFKKSILNNWCKTLFADD